MKKEFDMTTIITCEVTYNFTNKEPGARYGNPFTEEEKRWIAEPIKRQLGADDVQVLKIQEFIMEEGDEMHYTDDPVADFHRYSAEQEEAMSLLPRCSECGDPIQDESCFVINDEVICESCMNGYKKFVVDLMG